MEVFDYEIHLTDREYGILIDLYHYRVMTTFQIKNKHFGNKGTYVNKVLNIMREKNLIKSMILKNSRKGKKGYSYHRLTETGLERLSKRDMSVEGKSSLYVKPLQVPFILMANDLVVDLADTDWEIWDSRKVKTHFNLDERMNIQGLMISPEKKEYGLYVLDKNTHPNNIGKIQSEIRSNIGLGIENHLIITKGRNSYNAFVNYALEPTENSKYYRKPLLTGYEMQIHPYQTFISKTTTYRTNKEWLIALCNLYDITIKSTEKEEKRQSFSNIVDFQGEEMYLVDCTDSDINKINDIDLYTSTSSGYRWENRKIVAICIGMPNKATKKLMDIANLGLIKLIIVNPSDMESLFVKEIE